MDDWSSQTETPSSSHLSRAALHGHGSSPAFAGLGPIALLLLVGAAFLIFRLVLSRATGSVPGFFDSSGTSPIGDARAKLRSVEPGPFAAVPRLVGEENPEEAEATAVIARYDRTFDLEAFKAQCVREFVQKNATIVDPQVRLIKAWQELGQEYATVRFETETKVEGWTFVRAVAIPDSPWRVKSIEQAK